MGMVLHLLEDPDFDELVIRQYESCCPSVNLFLLFSIKRRLNLPEIFFKGCVLFEEDDPVIDFSEIDGIIIHYLSIKKAKFIQKVPKNIILALSIWGGDFYNFLPEYRKKLFSKLTEEYIELIKYNKGISKILEGNLFFKMTLKYYYWKKAINRIELYSTIIPDEKGLVEKHFDNHIRYIPIPTYSINKIISIYDINERISTKENLIKNICIGNSGTLSNNHIEVLDFFNKTDSRDLNFFAPLTYGDHNYIQYICKIGNSFFGDNFIPLLNHLAFDDFKEYMNQFNICIFNSYRQQGIATIVIALWNGSKVYLSRNNVTFKSYRDAGIQIFSIEEDLFQSDRSSFLSPISHQEIIKNRRILLNLYSDEKIKENINQLYKSIKQDKFKL